MRNWATVTLSLLIAGWSLAQPIPMTREEAGQIALQFAQAGNYPGTLHYLTVEDLPEKMEVHEKDKALIEQLAREGRDWAVTMIDHEVTWFGVGGLYELTYVFLVSFNQWPDRLSEARVNAYTGYCEIQRFRKSGETNDDLGYGSLPVKTFEELQGIALNIAEQTLGPGTFAVYTEPYDLSNPEHYELVSQRGCYFLIFRKDPQTGAHLPKVLEIVLNSRTGAMEAGHLYNRDVAVSTTPTITKEQAKQAVVDYVTGLGYEVVDWLPEGFHGFESIIYGTAVGRDAVVGLHVVEGPFLEQYLMWILLFAYKWNNNQPRLGGAMVNAHTGEVVLGFTSAVHMTGSIKSKKVKQEDGISIIYINDKTVYPYTQIPIVNGRVYVPVNWAYGLGAKWDGTKLSGTRGTLVVKDKLRRHGRLYLPLRSICEVSGIRLWWDNKRKVPILRAEWLEAKKLLAQRQR